MIGHVRMDEKTFEGSNFGSVFMFILRTKRVIKKKLQIRLQNIENFYKMFVKTTSFVILYKLYVRTFEGFFIHADMPKESIDNLW